MTTTTTIPPSTPVPTTNGTNNCEFRFWILGDTTYSEQGWKQMTIAELNTFKDEFVAQYNANGGLQPIATYTIGSCKICQDLGVATGYSPTWSTWTCPSIGTTWQWTLNHGTYYTFGYYHPLITTGTFTSVSSSCSNNNQHSVFAKCSTPGIEKDVPYLCWPNNMTYNSTYYNTTHESQNITSEYNPLNLSVNAVWCYDVDVCPKLNKPVQAVIPIKN
eukprot:498839_1